MPDGKLQTRDVEYEELHAPDGQKPKKTEQYKEPAYPWPGETVGLVAPVVEAVAAAPVADEWQSTNPPCAGWYEATCAEDHGGGHRARYWDERAWSSFCWLRESVENKKRDMTRPTERTGIQWRGPRLTGAEWPEPEAPKAASFTITIKAGGGASAGSSGGAVAHGVGGACSGTAVYSAQDCRAAYLAAPSGKDRRDLAILRQFVPGAGPIKDLLSVEQVPEHRRAEFIVALAALS